MSNFPTISRPDPAIVAKLAEIGSATAAGELAHLGIRDPHIRGPVALKPGRCVAGPALTLQFMPKREDLHSASEYEDPEKQIHRHVLYQVEKGDILVVDARADMSAGVFGEMMLTYLAGRGGKGVVIDGCIRDSRKAMDIDLGYWVRGVTPNFHIQTGIVPFAVNVPVACGGALVMPGDIIVADDDGAVVVPVGMAEALIERASRHAEWEEFSRIMLSRGGDLRRYYPLSSDAEEEFAQWKREQGDN